jgi:uncharacterized membrane protein YhaH (DUF805 family)
MPEFLQEFLAWYLAPWRRIGRKEFGIALTVATIPSIIIMFMGFGSGVGGFLDPIMQLSGVGQQVGNLELETNTADRSIGSEQLKGMGFAPQLSNPLASKAAPAPVKHSVPAQPSFLGKIDWSGIINGLCLLAMVPLSRMRLRDMGWFGWQENFLTVVFNISVVEGLIQSISGFDLLPMGTMFGFLNFLGYAWLSLAKGKPREAVHEKVPETWQPPAMPAKKNFDDEQY